nr:hypothetical protein [Haliscomenobacter sp.]
MVVVFNAWNVLPSAESGNFNPNFLTQKVLNAVVEYQQKKK